MAAPAQTTPASKILCISSPRGNISHIEELIQTTEATCVISVGNFGFYDERSLSSLSAEWVKEVLEETDPVKYERSKLKQMSESSIRKALSDPLQDYLEGRKKFSVPVYVIYGPKEDVSVLNSYLDGTKKIPNLHFLTEKRSLSDSGACFRGLGGQLDYKNLFNSGEFENVSGSLGSIWTTLLQIGQFFENFSTKTNEQVRIFSCSSSFEKDGLGLLLGHASKSDILISCNESSKQVEVFEERAAWGSRAKIVSIQDKVKSLWSVVGPEAKQFMSSEQETSIKKALEGIQSVSIENRRMTNILLPSIRHGFAIISIKNGVLSIETSSKVKELSHESHTPSETEKIKTYKCFVGSLPDNVTETQIRELFKDLELKSVELVQSKKIAFAEFKDEENQQLAINMNNPRILDKVVRIDPYDPNASRVKRQDKGYYNSSSSQSGTSQMRSSAYKTQMDRKPRENDYNGYKNS